MANVKKQRLTDIPEQVNPADIEEHKGKLLSPQVVQEIRTKVLSGEIKLSENSAQLDANAKDKLGEQTHHGRLETKRISKGELSKLGINSKYSVIVVPGKEGRLDIHAIYLGVKRGREIGKGSFGSVKLVQNQETGEFNVIKTMKELQGARKASQKREFDKLKKMDLMIGTDFFYEAKLRKEKEGQIPEGKRAVLIKRGPGYRSSQISERFSGRGDISPMLIALDHIDALQKFHQGGNLHLDLKGANIHYHPMRREATLIDMGNVLQKNEKGEALGAVRGTQVFMAPEIRYIFEHREHLNDIKSDYLVRDQVMKSHFHVKYTDKSDIYSLGITIGEAFNLLVENQEKVCWDIALPGSEKFQNNEFIPNETVRKEVVDYLKKMTAELPEDRPTLEEAKLFFNEMIKRLEQNSDNKVKVSVLDVVEYSKLDEDQRDIVKKGLSAVNPSEVMLVAADTQVDEYAIQLIKRELEDDGMLVKHDVYFGEKDVAVLLKDAQKQENATHQSYAFVTMRAFTPEQAASLKGAVGLAMLSPESEKAEIKSKVKMAFSSVEARQPLLRKSSGLGFFEKPASSEKKPAEKPTEVPTIKKGLQ